MKTNPVSSCLSWRWISSNPSNKTNWYVFAGSKYFCNRKTSLMTHITISSCRSVIYIQSFSVGAAHGMEYLADLKIIHCDLAARNCMQVLFCCSNAFSNQPPKTTESSLCFRLNKNMVLKISDFGLSRDMQTKEYYKVENTSMELPVRWMSPESLTNWTFTIKSDVVRNVHISQVSQEHNDASLFHWHSDRGKHFWLPFDEDILQNNISWWLFCFVHQK